MSNNNNTYSWPHLTNTNQIQIKSVHILSSSQRHTTNSSAMLALLCTALNKATHYIHVLKPMDKHSNCYYFNCTISTPTQFKRTYSIKRFQIPLYSLNNTFQLLNLRQHLAKNLLLQYISLQVFSPFVLSS